MMFSDVSVSYTHLDVYKRQLQYQTAQGVGNGGSNSALDMGMGFAVANKMAEVLNKPKPAAPPSLPDNEWHVAIDQAASGPHSFPPLQPMVRSGTLTPTALVWQNGMAAWQAAGEVAALAALFKAQTLTLIHIYSPRQGA